MDKKRQIPVQDAWEHQPERTKGFVTGSLVRTSTALFRSFIDAAALRVPERKQVEPADHTRKAHSTLPNGYILSFIAIAVIPSLLSVLYLVFIASDQFVAEARFAVRNEQLELGADKSKSMGSASMSLNSGSNGLPMLASQDAYIITNYIGSRAILQDLADKIDVKAIFQRPEADFWARLKDRPSAEELTDYWRKMVSTYVDAVSGIVILTVRSFRPGDSEALAKTILDASEKLANDMSLRARRAVMKDAEEEVRRSEGQVRAALLDMRTFRDAQGYIDPTAAATNTSKLLMEAMSEKIRLENDYFVAAKAMSPTASSVVGLKTRIDVLDGQIEQLKATLTGNSAEGKTIAASLGTFEELELKRIFAEKLYTIAQDALERARLKAQQQSIYLTTFVSASLPEESRYPERPSLSLLLPLGFLIIWGILAMTAAAIEDHRA